MVKILQPDLTTLIIYYYRPEYVNLIQEFTYQFDDVAPKFPRAHKFLLYWKDNIDAVLKEVYLMHVRNNNKTINAREIFKI